MGTPDFAVPALDALIQSRHEVVGVMTNPDRRSGRGKKVHPSPVKARALEAGIEVYQPPKVRKNPEVLEVLERWQPDLAVVAAYGQILPQSVLDAPKMGCLNIHASLLPGYRGAAPINWCIVRGETRTGITIMEMEAGLDTGPMLSKVEVEITDMMTAQQLHDELCVLGGPLLLETIDGLLDGSITPEPQDDERASWAPMIKKENGLVDWTRSAREVADLIRGFNPWPGAYTFHHAEDTAPQRVKMHLARPVELSGAPGEVLKASDGELIIACGQGAIECVKLQAPGRKAMAVRDFLNGYHVSVSDRFAAEEL